MTRIACTRHPATADRGATILIVLPLEAKPEKNARGHWAKKARRTKAQRDLVGMTLAAVLFDQDRAAVLAACRAGRKILLQRVAPRALDKGDGLPCSLAAVRDSVACWLLGGRVGQRDDEVGWEYAQRRGPPKTHAVEIELPTQHLQVRLSTLLQREEDSK